MKEIPEARLEDIEDLAMDGVKEIRAYFKYQGSDRKYFEKAKTAASVISAYARLRATETNRMALELHAQNAQSRLMEVGVIAAEQRVKELRG